MEKRIKKVISIILVMLMVFSGTVTAFADEVPKEESAAEGNAEELEREKEAEKKAAEEARKVEEEKAKAEQEAAEKAKEEAKAEAAEKAKEEAKTEATPKTESEIPSQKSDFTVEKEESEAQTEKRQETISSTDTKEHKKGIKLNAGLSDGTYKADDFKMTGGTGKLKVTCEKVIVNSGKYWGVFSTTSDNLTHVYTGKASKEGEITSLFDPDTHAVGTGVYHVSEKQFTIPIEVNKAYDVSGRTVAMSAPKWIAYSYTVTLSDTAEKISDDATVPDDPGPSPSDDPDPTPQDDPEPVEPAKTKTLKDGTYKVKATTDRRMFYLYPKEKNPATVVLVKKNGKMTATITLTGSGYDYVYMGSYKYAIKKSNKSKWIKAKKVNGYYTFKIPVSKLDKKLTISPHSWKYQKQYGDTLNKDHCPWRPDKWIMFYSKGAKKVKDGTSIKTKGKASNRNGSKKKGSSKGKNDGKAAKESKYKDDSGKSTSAVNNSTGLKDGVYTPDRFSWSGGSGRLAYIRCNKITVKGGKAFATIEFSSSKYDSLKANGRVYSKGGGGNAKFTIPVKMNANNTIIGRTTAMSQPHWVRYTIFIYKKGAAGGKGDNSAEGDDGHVTSTKKLSEKAPDLLGLKFEEKVDVKYAEYFKIFKYEQGITLIAVDQSADTALYKKEKKDSKKDKKADNTQAVVEYDEDGKPIAKGLNEITEMLYHNNVVNYLVVPEKAEIPAGLEKDCVIINQPVEASYIASEPVLGRLVEMGLLDSVSDISMAEQEIKNKEVLAALKDKKLEALDDAEKPDYTALVKAKADFAVFPDAVLPEIVPKKGASEDAKAESDEKAAKLGIIQSRFSALGVPMIIDRSGDEKTNYAETEWIKVYGVIYGCEDKADKIFDDFVKDNKEEKKAKDEKK